MCKWFTDILHLMSSHLEVGYLKLYAVGCGILNFRRVGLEPVNTYSDTSRHSKVQCAIDGVLGTIFMAAESG